MLCQIWPTTCQQQQTKCSPCKCACMKKARWCSSSRVSKTGRLIVADASAALALLQMAEHLFKDILRIRCVGVTRWDARRKLTWRRDTRRCSCAGQALAINSFQWIQSQYRASRQYTISQRLDEEMWIKIKMRLLRSSAWECMSWVARDNDWVVYQHLTGPHNTHLGSIGMLWRKKDVIIICVGYLYGLDQSVSLWFKKIPFLLEIFFDWKPEQNSPNKIEKWKSERSRFPQSAVTDKSESMRYAFNFSPFV